MCQESLLVVLQEMFCFRVISKNMQAKSKNGKIWYANSFYNKFKISSGIVIISAYYGVNRQINSSIMNWIAKKFI